MAKNKKPVKKHIPITKEVAVPKEWAINNKLNWIILLLVVLPFIFSRKSMEPALSPRFIFESCFLALYHLYFFGIRGDKYFIRLPKLAFPIFLLAIGFAIWSLIAIYSATNIGESTYEVSRNFLNLLLLFTVAHAALSEKINFILLCKWIALAALVHSMIGFDENFSWGFTKFPGGASPHGLMANRNLFGSAQVLVLPFVIYLIYQGKGLTRGFAIFTAMWVVGSIYIAQTRAAWVSATLVLIVIILLVLIFLPELKKRALIVVVTMIAGLSLTLGFVEFDESLKYQKRKSRIAEKRSQLKQETKKPETQISQNQKKDSINNSIVGAEIFSSNSESVKERLVVWSESIGIVKDNPLLGVGPGNWKVTVPKYRIGGIRNDYGKIVRIRPHNIYVQIVTENGFVGFLLYYSCWVLILIGTIKVLLKSKEQETKLLMIMLIAGFIAFASDGFFSFPLERYEHTMFIHFMMGLAIALYIKHTDPATENKGGWKYSRLLVIPVLGFLGWNIFLGMERHTFEYHMNRAKVFQKRKDNAKILVETVAGKSKFVSLDPNKDPLEIQSAMALKNLGREFLDKGEKGLSSMYYDSAMVEAKKALFYSPHSTRNLNTLGTIYTETKQYDNAIATYNKALFYAPKYEVTLKNLALNYLYAKKYDSCLYTLTKFEYKGDEMFEKVFRSATYYQDKQAKEEASQVK